MSLYHPLLTEPTIIKQDQKQLLDFRVLMLMQNRKITFIYHVPFWVENGRVYAEHPAIGRYVEALAAQTTQVAVLAPKRIAASSMAYHVRADNVTVSQLPAYQNIQQFWFQAIKYYYLFWRAAPEWDLLNIRMPTHAGFPAFLAAIWHKKTVFLVVVGEGLATSKFNGYPFLKQGLANLEARLQDHLMNIMVRRCLTFTNGEDLYQKLNRPGRQVYVMRSSTIHESDIESPDKDTCQHSPYQILTVGSISPLKGTTLIPHIIAILNKKGINIDWLYVGSEEGNSGKQEMRLTLQHATELGVLSHLKFLGPMAWGSLYTYYRKCDLFVLPTCMEGVPRVILEAQAAGLPVITTSVGGIPKAVKNGKDALLVNPGKPDELAVAIEKIVRNKNLRCQLIQNGIESARQATIEAETEKMLERVAEHLRGKN